jgi:fucose permease
VPPFRLACLTFLCLALPGTTLGMLWPAIRLSLHQPVGALGIVLACGVAAQVLASVATGQVVTALPATVFLSLGSVLSGIGLATSAVSSSLFAFTAGSVLFGIGFGVVNATLNANAARHLGPRDLTWLHASYGLGAIIGPLLVTALLSLGWRAPLGIFAGIQLLVGLLLAFARRTQQAPTPPREATPTSVTTLVVAVVETGVEAGAGVWGYLFLTAGRGLSPEIAGLAVSAYWAMMFVGRALLGPVAERVGVNIVLGWAIGGVAVGAALMAGPAPVAVAGMMVIGLAAAPIVPLLALTANTMRAVAWQAAASAVGSAVLPAGMGLAIDAVEPAVLAPLLLVLSLAMCLLCRLR